MLLQSSYKLLWWNIRRLLSELDIGSVPYSRIGACDIAGSINEIVVGRDFHWILWIDTIFAAGVRVCEASWYVGRNDSRLVGTLQLSAYESGDTSWVGNDTSGVAYIIQSEISDKTEYASCLSLCIGVADYSARVGATLDKTLVGSLCVRGKAENAADAQSRAPSCFGGFCCSGMYDAWILTVAKCEVARCRAENSGHTVGLCIYIARVHTVFYYERLWWCSSGKSDYSGYSGAERVVIHIRLNLVVWYRRSGSRWLSKSMRTLQSPQLYPLLSGLLYWWLTQSTVPSTVTL